MEISRPISNEMELQRRCSMIKMVLWLFLIPDPYSPRQIVYSRVLYKLAFLAQGIVQFCLAYINSYKVDCSQTFFRNLDKGLKLFQRLL